MQYRAIVSFSGLISMSSGEVREIADQKIVNDLLKAGYILPSEAGLEPVTRGKDGTDSALGADEGSKSPATNAGPPGKAGADGSSIREAGVKKGGKKGGKKKNEN